MSNSWVHEIWVSELRSACEATSQSDVAERLQREAGKGYPSPALLNQVLKGVYTGNIERIKTLVEGVLMSEMVDCPALGHEIPRQRCIENHTRKDWPLTGSHRAMLKRICPGCENNTCRRVA